MVLVLLHNGVPQHNLARECGWPQKAVSDAVREICGVLAKHAPDYIVLPDKQELADIAASIESWGNSRLPNCVGAVDGTHVPVQSSDRSYQNSKKYKSLNFQVYVDDAGFIRNVSGGQPGCVHDSDLFVNSVLYDYVKWLSELGHKFIHGVTVGYYIVGDGGYAQSVPGLQTPFKLPSGATHLNPEHRDWNFWHASARMIVENVFGQLKGRFGILVSTHRLKYTPAQVKVLFMSCCVLHNICVMQRDTVARENWVDHREGCRWEDSTTGQLATRPGDAQVDNKQQRYALLRHLEDVHANEFNDNPWGAQDGMGIVL